MTANLQFDRALVGARLLWRHWTRHRSDERQEGFIQEFSPTGANVRISGSIFSEGDWMETGSVRVLEVLEVGYVQRMRREAEARRKAEEAKAKKGAAAPAEPAAAEAAPAKKRAKTRRAA